MTGRRGISLILVWAVLTVQTVFPVRQAFAEEPAAESVEYQPVRQRVAIAPAALYQDARFYNQYVKTNETNYFNSISQFTDDNLNFNTVKKNYNAAFTKTLWELDPVLETLRQKQQLLVNLRVSLANKASSYFENKGIQAADIPAVRSYWGLQDDSNYRVYGDYDFARYEYTVLDIRFSKSGKDGTKMQRASLLFADGTPPAISEVYTTEAQDKNSTRIYACNAGVSSIYIQVKFNEYIRFSDNSPQHGDVYLKLGIAKIGGDEVTGANQTARLVCLKEDTLTFRYDIPPQINGSDISHYIYKFGGIFDRDGKDILNAGDEAYTLKALTATGELEGTDAAGAFHKFTSRSLITDLAGNPSGSTVVPSPVKPVYMDKVAPCADGVSMVAAGDKSQYIGAGGSITPTVTFTEPLFYYNGTDFIRYNSPDTFQATLNVKDRSGNNITVRGSQFNEDSSKLIFKTLAIEDGMVLEAGAESIRIKSIHVSNPVNPPADARGNGLDTGGIPLPANQFLVDTEKPEISTNMPHSGGVYTPHLYAASGSGNNSFYFSFGLEDSLSGVLPVGTGQLSGSFKWEPADSAADTSKLSFQYAVTTDASVPSAYTSGAFGSGYAFPQLERSGADNLYIHIKAEGLEGLELDRSKLHITATDLVGNTGTSTYVLDGSQLDSVLDHTAPDIAVTRLYSCQEGGTWKFAADVTLTDKSKIAADKVQYQWTEKSTAPADDRWTLYPGLGTDAESVSATVTKDLMDDELNAYDLYIRSEDKSNNGNLRQAGPYSFTKDMRAPKFEVQAANIPTQKAQLKITASAQSADMGDGAGVLPATILTVVGSVYGSVTADTALSIGVFDDISNWSVSSNPNIAALIDGTYYGETKVRIISGYGISYDGSEVINPHGSMLSEEEYTLYTAPSKPAIHAITMRSSLEALSDGWTGPSEGPKYYTDLAGSTFLVSAENTLVPGWGSKDMDFDNSWFELYKEGNATPIYKTTLGMATAVSIPAGLAYETGTYYARATVTAKTSGKVETQTIENIRVDVTRPGNFGLSKTETDWNFDNPELTGLIGTHTVFYGYDRDDNSVDTYDGAPYLLLGSSAPRILSGGAEVENTGIRHKLYFSTLSDHPEMYVRVWNASPGVDAVAGKAAAVWQPIGEAVAARVVESAGDIPGNYSAGVVPLINNTENVLYYQVCHANGIKSSERVLLANVRDELPELEVALTPDAPTAAVTAAVSRVSSVSSPDMKVFYWDGTAAPVEVSGEVQISQADNNWFYTSNVYGNYIFLRKQAPQIDRIAPVLSTLQVTGEGDAYAVGVTISDKNACTLSMKFEDAYMARLGLSGYFPLELPEANGTWVADSARPDGIYKIERSDYPDGTVGLTLYGVYLYDDTRTGTVNLEYSLTARDAAGNANGLSGMLSNIANVRPDINLAPGTVRGMVRYYYNYSDDPEWDYLDIDEDRMMDLYCVTGNFNLPVRNVTPVQHHDATTEYSLRKDFLSIFKDGDCTVTYDDIFGNSYRTVKTVSGIDIDVNMTLSGVDPQTGKYTLAAEPVANVGKEVGDDDVIPFAVFADKYEVSFLNMEYTRTFGAIRTNLQFDGNENAILAMMELRGDGWHLDGTRPLIVIDSATRQAPAVTVHWYYHEFASDSLPEGETKTDRNVDVWLTADSPITGINDKLLSHTFTYGGDTSYTFEYRNSEGAIGVQRVVLPADMVESKGDDGFTDTTPPDCLVNVYGKYGSMVRALGSWDPVSDPDEIRSLLTWSGAFTLKLEVLDESKTKLVLLEGADRPGSGITYDNAQSDEIEGVSLSGNEIVVSGQNGFTVLLVDEADNRQAFSFPSDLWDKIDAAAPELDTVSRKPVTFTAVEVLFTLKDDRTAAGDIELVSPAGIAKDTEGNYILPFTENKSVQISMRDLAGNIGTAEISVATIDDQPPAASVVWWSQGLYDSSTGTYDPRQLTTSKTNRTITAKIALNKAIKSVNAGGIRDNSDTLVPAGQEGNYVTWSNETDSILVNFLQNAFIELSFVAVNGKTGSIDLGVSDLIDKTAPAMTVVPPEDKDTATAASVTFKDFSEPVYIYGPGESGKLYQMTDALTRTFTERGSYSFRFTDEAGNTTDKTMEIKNIDENPPGILLSELPAAGEYFKDAVTFKATMSEAGTLSCNGTVQNVAAPVDDEGDGKFEDEECNWVSFTVTQNGSYPLVATDRAGRKTTTYVNISSIDRAAPIMTFSPATITVLSSTDLQSFLEMLDRGITLQDDLTAAPEITLTHEQLTASQLSTPGLYQLKYTAKDLAGNERTAIRYVKVYSAVDISVTVNGVRAEPGGTVVLSGQQAVLTIANLPLGDNEPYKVYLRKGKWTGGAMKNMPPLDNPASFELPDEGCFYTLYIVTQNRGTYLTYLYAQ